MFPVKRAGKERIALRVFLQEIRDRIAIITQKSSHDLFFIKATKILLKGKCLGCFGKIDLPISPEKYVKVSGDVSNSFPTSFFPHFRYFYELKQHQQRLLIKTKNNLKFIHGDKHLV